MSDRWCRWDVMAITLLLAAAPLFAQDSEPRIPSDISNSSTVLNDSQKGVIDSYVKYWIGILNSGGDDEVTTARNKLIEPFGLVGATDIFLTAYSASITRQIGPTLRSDRVLVRLNAMICVGFLGEQSVVEMIRAGLADKVSAVRYRSARAAGEVLVAEDKRPGNQKKFDAKQRQVLFEVLRDSLRAEQDQFVVEQLLMALLGLLDLPDARDLLIKKLDERVAIQAANPNLALKPVLEGLKKLALRGYELKDPAAAKQLLPLVARWFSLSATALRGQKADQAADSQFRTLVFYCDTVMRWCVKLLAPELTAQLPAEDVGDLVKNRNWEMLSLRDAEWRVLLTKPPLSIDANLLKVPAIPNRPGQAAAPGNAGGTTPAGPAAATGTAGGAPGTPAPAPAE